jgi:hypothetical protein
VDFLPEAVPLDLKVMMWFDLYVIMDKITNIQRYSGMAAHELTNPIFVGYSSHFCNQANSEIRYPNSDSLGVTHELPNLGL